VLTQATVQVTLEEPLSSNEQEDIKSVYCDAVQEAVGDVAVICTITETETTIRRRLLQDSMFEYVLAALIRKEDQQAAEAGVSEGLVVEEVVGEVQAEVVRAKPNLEVIVESTLELVVEIPDEVSVLLPATPSPQPTPPPVEDQYDFGSARSWLRLGPVPLLVGAVTLMVLSW